MYKLTTMILSGCMALAAGATFAQDAAKKAETDSAMTMQQCKDHMAMAHKDGAKKDDAMMKKDTMCADMMKKDAMPAEPAKK